MAQGHFTSPEAQEAVFCLLSDTLEEHPLLQKIAREELERYLKGPDPLVLQRAGQLALFDNHE
jgi:hypothetical protein